MIGSGFSFFPADDTLFRHSFSPPLTHIVTICFRFHSFPHSLTVKVTLPTFIAAAAITAVIAAPKKLG
jgi:hypothetical protein